MQVLRAEEGDSLQIQGTQLVVRAWYGVPGNEWKEENGKMVTSTVCYLAARRGTITVLNRVLGGDPAWLYRKVLVVEVQHRDECHACNSIVRAEQEDLNVKFFAGSQDYYRLFDFPRFSSPTKEEVARAKRECHRKYRFHPDQNHGLSAEEAKFKESQCQIIHHAAGVLEDPQLKEKYDNELRTALGLHKLSWEEKVGRGLLCTGMVLGGVVMIIFGLCSAAPTAGLGLGLSIGGSALLNAGIKCSFAQYGDPDHAWSKFGKDFLVGGLQGAAGGAIGVGFGAGLIGPAMNAGKTAAAVGWAALSGASTTAAAGNAISDFADLCDGTKALWHNELTIEAIADGNGPEARHFEVTTEQNPHHCRTGQRVRFFNLTGNKDEVREPDGRDLWARKTGEQTLLLFASEGDAKGTEFRGRVALKSSTGILRCCQPDGQEQTAVLSGENASHWVCSMAIGAAAGAVVQGVAALCSPGANAGQVADDVASNSKKAAEKLADNMKPQEAALAQTAAKEASKEIIQTVESAVTSGKEGVKQLTRLLTAKQFFAGAGKRMLADLAGSGARIVLDGGKMVVEMGIQGHHASDIGHQVLVTVFVGFALSTACSAATACAAQGGEHRRLAQIRATKEASLKDLSSSFTNQKKLLNAQDTPGTGHACERHMGTLEMAEARARHTKEPAGVFKEGDGQVIQDMVQLVEAEGQQVQQDFQQLLQKYGVENGDALPKGVKISSNGVPIAMGRKERPSIFTKADSQSAEAFAREARQLLSNNGSIVMQKSDVGYQAVSTKGPDGQHQQMQYQACDEVRAYYSKTLSLDSAGKPELHIRAETIYPTASQEQPCINRADVPRACRDVNIPDVELSVSHANQCGADAARNMIQNSLAASCFKEAEGS